MSKEYKRGYTQGKKETRMSIFAILIWTSIIIIMIIKAGIFVI